MAQKIRNVDFGMGNHNWLMGKRNRLIVIAALLICPGMQFMAQRSDEGEAAGPDWFDAEALNQ